MGTRGHHLLARTPNAGRRVLSLTAFLYILSDLNIYIPLFLALHRLLQLGRARQVAIVLVVLLAALHSFPFDNK